jgi:hypothetical protein
MNRPGGCLLECDDHISPAAIDSAPGIGYGQDMRPLVLFLGDFAAALGVSFALMRAAELCSRWWRRDDPPDDGGWRWRPRPQTPPDRGLERRAGAPDRFSPARRTRRSHPRHRVPSGV